MKKYSVVIFRDIRKIALDYNYEFGSEAFTNKPNKNTLYHEFKKNKEEGYNGFRAVREKIADFIYKKRNSIIKYKFMKNTCSEFHNLSYEFTMKHKDGEEEFFVIRAEVHYYSDTYYIGFSEKNKGEK